MVSCRQGRNIDPASESQRSRSSPRRRSSPKRPLPRARLRRLLQVRLRSEPVGTSSFMLEFKGEYGNSDSLAMKGLQYMHAPVKDEYTYQQAYHYFERALEIDAQDP